jgi:citrate lyase beta subunit
MRSIRALLYMPGDDRKKIEKAAGLEVDAVCLDLEDGVAFDQKEAAREITLNAISQIDFGDEERLIRINPIGSGLEEADLEMVLAAKPDGLIIPKVAHASDVNVANKALQDAGLSDMALLAQIESAAGLVKLDEIAVTGGSLAALIFGAEDYSADVGAKRSQNGEEVLFARSQVVAYAAANNLQAIDMLWVDYKDAQGLERLAQQGAGLGYDGMQIIHPAQIDIVQQAFSPSEQEIVFAERVIAAFENAKKERKGVFALDNKMVDMPMIRSAQRVLSKVNKN